MTADLMTRAAVSLGAILAVSGGGIVIIERTRRRSILSSVLAHRWFTWAILAPLWLAAAAWPAARVVLLTSLALIATHEFTRLRTSLVTVDRWILLTSAGTATLLTAAGVGPAAFVLAAALLSLVFPLLSQDIRNGPSRIGDMLIGVVFVVLPFSLLFEIAGLTSGSVFFTIGLAVAISDVGAFVIGSAAGGPRMSTVVSPNKTVAGLAGNLGGAALGIAIAAAAGLVGWTAVLAAPVIAVAAVAGDLFVSLLKRSKGVKDAGNILPGFGGLLDRVDSLLVVSPVLFVMVSTVVFSS